MESRVRNFYLLTYSKHIIEILNIRKLRFLVNSGGKGVFELIKLFLGLFINVFYYLEL